MTRFGRLKKSKESESFVFFLPRLIAEPGLVLNFSATALRNSVVRIVCLLVSDIPALGFLSYQCLPTLRILFQNQREFKFVLSDTHMPLGALSREVSEEQNE